MSRNLQTEIVRFSKELPSYQKLLAAYILNLLPAETTDNQAIEYAYKQCLFDSGMANQPLVPDYEFPDTETANEVVLDDVKLLEIKNLININALSTDQVIPLSENGLTIIYGGNGAGKSGYCRLMNSSFHSRGDKRILKNVYKPDDGIEPKGTFLFKKEDKSYELNFPDDISKPEFSVIAAFDSESIKTHIDERNQLYVMPIEFDFFNNLSGLIGKVSRKIEEKAQAIDTENKFIANFEEGSPISLELTKIDSNYDIEKLTKISTINEDEKKVFEELKKELAGLDTESASKKQTSLLRIKNELIEKSKALNTCLSELEQESLVDEVKKVIVEQKDLKKRASENSLNKFISDEFVGVGSELWKSFIGLGLEYSKKQAPVGNYPVQGKKCIYCRQELGIEAVTLLNAYSEFSKSEIESKLRESTKRYDALVLRANRIQGVNKIDDKSELGVWLKEESPDDLDLFNSSVDSASKLLQAIKEKLAGNDEVFETNIIKPYDPQSLIRALDSGIEKCGADKLLERKSSVDQQLFFLKEKEKLQEQIKAVNEYIESLKWLDAYELLKPSLRTTHITRKSMALYEEFISREYKQNFKEECLSLEIPHPELSERGSQGQAQREFKIGGTTPSHILSEGEQRAVALADFFTEAKLSSLKGLVFDDPVSSFDHVRRDVIAKRIAVEAQERQVLVFTHDLLFFNDLINHCTELSVEYFSHWMEKFGPGEVGLIRANTSPPTSNQYLDAKFARQFLDKAKKETNPQMRMLLIKEGYSLLRASYEAFFSSKVFAGSLSPYDRRVKYHQIDKIYAPVDVLKTIKEKLSALSTFVSAHIQPDVSTMDKAIDDLEQEIRDYQTELQNYLKDRKNSRVAPH